jgi:hypothetical protein
MTAYEACSRGSKYRSHSRVRSSSPAARDVLNTASIRSTERRSSPVMPVHSAIMSSRRSPVSGTAGWGRDRVSASATSGTLDGQRRYTAVLAAPARAATASTVSFSKPASSRMSSVARRMASSTSLLARLLR